MARVEMSHHLYLQSLKGQYRTARREGDQSCMRHIKDKVSYEIKRYKATEAFHTGLLIRQLREAAQISQYWAVYHAINRVERLKKLGRLREVEIMKQLKKTRMERGLDLPA